VEAGDDYRIPPLLEKKRDCPADEEPNGPPRNGTFRVGEREDEPRDHRNKSDPSDRGDTVPEHDRIPGSEIGGNTGVSQSPERESKSQTRQARALPTAMRSREK